MRTAVPGKGVAAGPGRPGLGAGIGPLGARRGALPARPFVRVSGAARSSAWLGPRGGACPADVRSRASQWALFTPAGPGWCQVPASPQRGRESLNPGPDELRFPLVDPFLPGPGQFPKYAGAYRAGSAGWAWDRSGEVAESHRSRARGSGEGAGSDRIWGVSCRLLSPRLVGRAAGFHGAGGAVVARTAGCRHPPGASVQGNPDTRPSHRWPVGHVGSREIPDGFFTHYLPGRKRRVCLLAEG